MRLFICVYSHSLADMADLYSSAQVTEYKQGSAQQACGVGMGSEGVEGGREDPRVSSVLERLSQLEGRVGGQLDQLVHLQQQQVIDT